ncbi:hypothetical protein DMENIID0001_008070 [Sergentomyia squamirostris]
MSETGEVLASPALILGAFLIIKLDPGSIVYYVTLVMVVTKFFFLCLFGQFIYNETEKIFTTLYLTRWYEMSLSDQKIILMMMKMSKEPFGFKALGVYDINIVMFVQVIKACFSYCAILYTFM